FVPLASLSAGVAFALLRSFDRRALVTLALTAIASWTSQLIPFLIPAALLVIGHETPGKRGIGWLAGFGFAATTAAIWSGTLGAVIIGTPLFAVGVWIGRRIWDVVERPGRRQVLAFILLFGF